MSLEKLKESLLKSPIVKKGDYNYVISPITDGIPLITPGLLNEVVDEIQKRVGQSKKVDKIVTLEAMGIPLASLLSYKMDIPFTIIRKRKYTLPDEVCVNQVTGYSKSKLFINGLKKEDNVIIVDDVLSTGGSLKAVLTALKEMGVNVKGVYIAVDKGNVAKKIEKEFNVEIKVLINLKVVDGKISLDET